MFTATGIGARRNTDNTISIKVRITDDRDGHVVSVQEYTAGTVVAAQTKIQQDLQALRAAENDGTLNAAVVGQVLGTI